MTLPRRVRAAVVAASVAAAATAQVDLGLGRMWTFHDPPREYLQREYGWVPDGAWLQHLQSATLRLGSGCSAAFVSPHGLVLTNHHCVRAAIARLQLDRDPLARGFVAATVADELPLAGLQAEQLVATVDVTERMQHGIEADDVPEVVDRKLAANRKALLAAEQKAPDERAEIVALFHGARYWLYRYRVFDDIRLVMAPEQQIAQFGGDPDNFVFPRYCIDFALCRAWVGDAPAATAATSLQWSSGPQEEQVVFLSGCPGGTQRLRTTAELEFLRDARYPRVRELIDHRLEILRAIGCDDGARQRALQPTVLAYENGQKLYRHEHAALLEPTLLQHKAAAQREFMERIAAVPALQARYADVFAGLERVATARRELEGRVAFCTVAGIPVLQRAVALLSGAVSSSDEAAAAKRPAWSSGDTEVDRSFAIDHLIRARRWLPADDPFLQALLGDEEPKALLESLDRSRLLDDAVFDAIVAGGEAAVAASADIALVKARLVLPVLTAVRTAQDGLEARSRALSSRLAQALFQVYGHEVAPDATFTPRFADGRVRGYESHGVRVPWRTVLHGLYARSAEFDGAAPFDLPESWRSAADRLDLGTPIDFVCTVDAAGGNSGSAVVDRDLRVVGLLFDGNLESLGNEFFFGDRRERAVCVHPLAIELALEKVYGAAHLVRELRRE